MYAIALLCLQYSVYQQGSAIRDFNFNVPIIKTCKILHNYKFLLSTKCATVLYIEPTRFCCSFGINTSQNVTWWIYLALWLCVHPPSISQHLSRRRIPDICSVSMLYAQRWFDRKWQLQTSMELRLLLSKQSRTPGNFKTNSYAGIIWKHHYTLWLC